MHMSMCLLLNAVVGEATTAPYKTLCKSANLNNAILGDWVTRTKTHHSERLLYYKHSNLNLMSYLETYKYLQVSRQIIL